MLLSDAVAFPSPSEADPGAQTAANDVRTDDAESLLRSYVAANLVPGTAPAGRIVGDRNFLRLEAANLHRGALLTKSPRFQNLMELCREIAGATGLRFDVVQEGDVLRFKVWTPADRSKLVRLDMANDLLASASYGVGVPSLTYPIVAGQGEGIERTIFAVSTAEAVAAESAWGRRIERFIDQRQTDDTAELTQKGQAELTKALASATGLTAVPTDSDTMRLGADWACGDIVSVVIEGQEVPAPVTEVALGIDRARVTIVATLGDMTAFDADAAADSRAATTASRVSALERTAENVKNLQLVDLGGNLPISRITGIVPTSGTAAERDAFYGAPATDADRVALANKKPVWRNTDTGWEESYYAPAGLAGLTARGLVAGAAAGWYPTGAGTTPEMVLQPTAQIAASAGNYVQGWPGITTRVGGADWFTNNSGAIFAQKAGYYDLRAWTVQQAGTGTANYHLVILNASNAEVAKHDGGAFTLVSNLFTTVDLGISSRLLNAGEQVLLRCHNGALNVHAASIASDIRGQLSMRYVRPPLVSD